MAALVEIHTHRLLLGTLYSQAAPSKVTIGRHRSETVARGQVFDHLRPFCEEFAFSPCVCKGYNTAVIPIQPRQDPAFAATLSARGAGIEGETKLF